jgi:hypothetical protein
MPILNIYLRNFIVSLHSLYIVPKYYGKSYYLNAENLTLSKDVSIPFATMRMRARWQRQQAVLGLRHGARIQKAKSKKLAGLYRPFL